MVFLEHKSSNNEVFEKSCWLTVLHLVKNKTDVCTIYKEINKSMCEIRQLYN